MYIYVYIHICIYERVVCGLRGSFSVDKGETREWKED